MPDSFVPDKQDSFQPDQSAVSRLFDNLWQKLNPAPLLKAVGSAVTGDTGPLVDLGKAIVKAHADEFNRAAEEFKEGKPVAALTSAAYGSIPIVGPAWDAAAEQIAKGDVAGGIGSMVGIAAPLALGDPAVQSAIKGVAGKASTAASSLPIPGIPEGAAVLTGHPHLAASLYLGRIIRGIAKKGSETASPAAAEVPTIYDDIAQGMAKKPYASLDPATQSTIRTVAERMQNPPAQEAPAAGQQLPPDWWKTAEEKASPAPAPAASPAQAAPTPAAQPQPIRTAPLVAAELPKDAVPVEPPKIGPPLQKRMTEGGEAIPEPGAKVIEMPKPGAEAPTEATTGPGAKGNPFEAAGRAKKAQAIAKFLHMEGQGISYEDALRMNPEHQAMAAKGAAAMFPELWPKGMDAPSPATWKQVLNLMQLTKGMAQ